MKLKIRPKTIYYQPGDPQKSGKHSHLDQERPSYDPIRKLIGKSSIIFLLMVSLITFLGEALIMVFLNELPDLTPLSLALIDATILMVILAPMMYFLVFRPLIRIINKQENIQIELEERIQKRTTDLETSNKMLQEEILKRKRIEEEINIERRRLFSVLEELPASVHLVGSDYTIRFANRYFREHFSDEDRPCYKILHGRDEPCIVCHAREVFENRCPGIFEEYHNDNRLYRIHNYPFVDIDGSRLVLQLGIDITDQKKAENALRESENRFRVLVNSINDTVFRLDKSMRIVEMYGELTAQLGRSKDFYLGKLISQVSGAKEKQIHEESIKKALSGKKTIYEWESDFPEGRRFLQTSMAPIFDTKGQIVGAVGVARDITSRKMLERKIIETEKLLAVAQMSAMIAHEFRNSLTSVRVILELLLEATPTEKSLEVALGSVGHLEEIVTQLLKFAKPSPLKFESANLNQILQESIEFIRGQLKKQKISLVLLLDNKLPVLAVDTNLLKEAVVNLLLNAVQSVAGSEKGGHKREIKILSGIKRITRPTAAVRKKTTARRTAIPDDKDKIKQGTYQIVEIADSGTGIKAEHIRHIFDPFFTTKSSGTGLGLATVKRTIEAHHGYILVKRGTGGRGTRFMIYLPANEKVNDR